MNLRTIRFLLILTANMLASGYTGVGQELSKVQISNIDFELDEGNIVITYDLLKAERTERFIVFANAITESGDTILARSVSGDVDENVSGGRKKSITWNYQRDNFFTKEAFHIEVTALPQLVDISEIS